ncbi:MAG: Fic family protein [Leptolyngbyaceae bacterium]|nr:Fic family protein [Leptolyngbyaceae bacterium]
MDLKNFKPGIYNKQGDYKSLSPTKVNIAWICTDPYTHVLLEEANRLLGELNAFSRIVPNVDLFIRMHIVKEATQSSRIEGTRTEIVDALMDKGSLAPEKQDDWQEVRNYIEATEQAIKQLKKLPVCSRLLTSAHKTLMRGVRGEGKAPGEFRKVQNWIGGRSPAEAVHVPPIASEVPGLMSDLELFLNNSEIHVPHLLRIAIGHYQFETIHPFLDGNGRTGRLLIVLYLIQNGLLLYPTLYLSDYLEKKRREYFDCLSGVRSSGGMERWVIFFLGAIIETCKAGCKTFEKILVLRNQVDEEIRLAGSRGVKINMLFHALYRNPIIELGRESAVEGLSQRTLSRLVEEFVDRGYLVELSGKHRFRSYAFKRYLDLFKANSS